MSFYKKEELVQLFLYYIKPLEIILAKKTTELVLLFCKKTTKLVFLWPNMGQKSIKDLRTFQHRIVMKQRFFRKARKDTWNKFINSRTLTKKVWEKFRKVNRNFKPRIVPPLDRRENIITSPDKIAIADTFADHYANISKGLHKKSKNKKREEQLLYNKAFTDRELKAVINQ